jgi:hypothetical protein
MSRHNSPVPTKPARSSASPSHTPSPTPQALSRPPSSARHTSSSSTRAASISAARSRLLTNNQGNSGSETERESPRSHQASQDYSPSDSMSNTPTSQHSEVILPIFNDTSRSRRTSAPSSPRHSRSSRLPGRNSSPPPTPGPSQVRSPRKRASMAVTASEREQLHEGNGVEQDVMSAALAAVASARRSRSPGGSGAANSVRRRGLSRTPLPREFREPQVQVRTATFLISPPSSRTLQTQDSEEVTPHTPHRDRHSSKYHRSPSPSARNSSSQLSLPLTNANGHHSPRRYGTPGRTSTVRELTRKHQTRWLSEDLSASASYADVEDVHETPGRSNTSQTNYSSGRRQTARGGSDGPLSPGRSLLGEGLRAAGIIRKRDSNTADDPFVNGGTSGLQAVPTRRTRSTGANSVVNDGYDWDSPISARPSSLVGNHSGRRSVVDHHTPEVQRPDDRGPSHANSSTRPLTSMAALHHDSPANASRGTPGSGRGYQPAGVIQRESSTSSTYDADVDATGPSRAADRQYTTPFSKPSTRPPASTSGAARDNHAEHRRLMLETLSMFESHLSRLPPMGHTTTSTIPEVFQASQQLVHGLDRLNNLLRTATGKALEAQIDAELADGGNEPLADVWSQIGGEHREHLRVSDELVRTMTQFLIGVGKVIRDATGNMNAQHHYRSISLDDDIARKSTPEAKSATSDKLSSDGRLSRETRRSWEAGQSLNRLANTDRSSNGTSSRPTSSLHQATRSSVASSSDGRSPSEGATEQTPPATRNVSSAISSASSRRLYTPRERTGDSAPVAALMSSLDSQETIHGYEPSPTPASRVGRALPPLAIPPSLPTLPSESLITRRQVTGLDQSRRKASSNSNITIRAEPSLPSVIKPPNTTTALTTLVVSDVEVAEMTPINRSDSESSAHTNGVTFSRPSSVSASTLSSLQQFSSQGNRARTISDNLKEELASLRSPMSGSETERPRNTFSKGRTSLGGTRPEPVGRSTQVSTLTSRAGRERRKTITEIFAQADH